MREDDPAQLAELAPSLRARVAALLAAAQGAVWIVSGRRSTQEQVDLRRAHCGPTWWDIWKKPARDCSPPTAIPGTSKHETGEAVDLGGNLGLAHRIAKKVGIHFPVGREDWHGEVDAGANVQGFAGGPFPDDWPIDIGLNPPGLPGGDITDWPGDIGGAVEDAVGNVLGTITEPLLEGASRVALVGVLLAGGVGLVVLGGIRGAQQPGGT